MMRLALPVRAIWEFVVGDDWLTGVGLIVALALTALVANAGLPAWWLMPVAVLCLLCASLWRRARHAAKDRHR